MMLPAKMQRIALFVPKMRVNETIEALGRSGAVQVERISADFQKLLLPGGLENGDISKYAQLFRSIEQITPKTESDYILEFRDIGALLKKAKSIKAVEKLVRLNRRLDELNVELSRLSYEADMADRLSGFNHDTKILNGQRIMSFLVSGEKPLLDKLSADLSGSDGTILFNINQSIIAVVDKSKREIVVSAAQKLKLKMEAIPLMAGKASVVKKHLSKNISKLLRSKRSLDRVLRKVSKDNFALITAVREGLELEEKKNELAGRMGYTDSIAVLEGWMPVKSRGDIKTAVGAATNGRFILQDVRTNEIAPTKLENRFPSKLFEFFIKFYSLPTSTEFDPTFMFSLAFPVFFGLMTGDVGYGASMLVLFGLIIWKLTSKKPTFKVPRRIARFIHTIMSNHALLSLSKAVLPGAALAIVFGVVFNEYFGFHLPYTALFNPELSLATLLLISGWIGVFMVSLGFVLGAINKWMVNDRKRAIGRLGWLAIGLGITFLGLRILSQEPISTSDFTSMASIGAVAGGLAIVLVSEGFESLLELPSIISHILSYTRLIGILLSSVILAEVINTVFLGSLSGGIAIAVFGVAILIVGQLFNLVIAIFESGIQGARLIYVEFFSKFYTGNGSLFSPFRISRKHTAIKSREVHKTLKA